MVPVGFEPALLQVGDQCYGHKVIDFTAQRPCRGQMVNFFSKNEGLHDSNCATTKRKVFFGLGTES